MHGKNPKRPPENGDGKTLQVQEIFPTIQGEGPNTGEGAVFLRLGGCNLACEFCDTEFESFSPKNTYDIINEISNLSKNSQGRVVRKLVVITGGEPFRQPIEYLCNKLIEAGFKVQIETNGTIFRDLNSEIEIVCSPKNPGTGFGRIRPDLLEKITAFKFIISATDKNYNLVPDVGQNQHQTPVYIQPMDEYNETKNRQNLELVKTLAQENGYKISLQTHKILNIP